MTASKQCEIKDSLECDEGYYHVLEEAEPAEDVDNIKEALQKEASIFYSGVEIVENMGKKASAYYSD